MLSIVQTLNRSLGTYKKKWKAPCEMAAKTTLGLELGLTTVVVPGGGALLRPRATETTETTMNPTATPKGDAHLCLKKL